MPGDILIDGGNSYYVDDIRRAQELAQKGIHYVDVGTSGGVWGRERGYCLMIGGETAAVEHLDPIFAQLAPGAGDTPRTPGRESIAGTAERGYLHCGPNGAGHFVKMVHNGIEYGVMAAYAEGLGILRSANVGKRADAVDAETTPLGAPERYQSRPSPRTTSCADSCAVTDWRKESRRTQRWRRLSRYDSRSTPGAGRACPSTSGPESACP